MLIVNVGRGELLRHLPRSKTIAEIGVFRGGFAELIRKRANPEKFHLIDPWGKDADDEYVNSYRVTDDMEALYQSIMQRYASQIRKAEIELHRDYSTVAAKAFADAYFDW